MERSTVISGLKTMAEKIINVAKEFSRTPGGRYYTDGEASGQEFRERILMPALRQYDSLIIELDGTRGYPSSFLDEAFVGAVRELGMSAADFMSRVKFKATGEFKIYVRDIESYVNQTAHA
jgi:hypothetical protein